MYPSHTRVFDEPSEETCRTAKQLGYACSLLAKSPSHANLSFMYLTQVILPAIEHKKVAFFFDDDGRTVGYVIWALLAEDVERRFIEEGDIRLHISEWNEGKNLWVIDMIALNGHVRYMLRSLRDEQFGDTESIRYFRIKKGKIFFRQIDRDASLSFFRS